MKKIISIILSLSTLLFCMVALSSCKKIDTDISNYELKRQEIGNAAEMMPSLSDLGNYSGINYSHQVREDFIFVSDAFSLFVKYSPSEYESKKQEILSSHTFLTSEITDDDGYYLIPVTKFDYMDYQFKIVKDDKAEKACQSFLMIGFNDEKYAVAFCYFYDVDFDFIAAPKQDTAYEMIDFVDYYFLWNAF